MKFNPRGTRKNTEIMDKHGAAQPQPNRRHESHCITVPGAVATGSELYPVTTAPNTEVTGS